MNCPRCLLGADGGECRKVERVAGHKCLDAMHPCVRCDSARVVEVHALPTGELVSYAMPCECTKKSTLSNNKSLASVSATGHITTDG